MKVGSIRLNKVDNTMKFLKERHSDYVNRQLTRPKTMRNPVMPKPNMFKDFLVLIGALPIKRPKIK